MNGMTKEKPEYLTTQDVAAYLSKCDKTIRDMANKGDLISVKRGRRLYFRLDNVIRYMESGN